VTLDRVEANYVVGVRTLCEFTAKQGDLDLRFTPSPSAREGVAGHGVVARRRAAGYQAEVSLSGAVEGLTVRGRADGFDRAANRLEEIKTHRGALERMPANHRLLHWAQAKVYAWLLCRQFELAEIHIALVYFDISSQTETTFVETHAAAALRAFFEDQCERFLAWSRQELAHAAARKVSLAALRFPHPNFRAGQRQLSEGIWRAASGGRCLMAQAPTGIGKTIGTVFPLLKAWPVQAFDKIFFLTAKSSGRRLALDALERLRAGEASPCLRVLELVARDKACEHPDKACYGDSCPLARGFYDRLPAARAQALADPFLDQAALRTVALEHAVCPYHLGQELVRWTDVVVGDYNHYFDLHAILFGLTVANEWRVGVLVDEAHNLLERARRMYTAELDRSVLKTLRRDAPTAVAKALGGLGRRWSELHKDQAGPYETYPAVPARFAVALRQVTGAIADHLAEDPAGVDSALLAFHFDALHFLRVLDLFGDHTLFDVTLEQPAGPRPGRPHSVLTLRNIVPAPHLKARFAAAHSSVLFSATLTPMQFHRDTLGLPDDTAWLDVESPFAAEQLTIRIASHVSTRFRQRDASLESIVELIARQFAAAPGNYLAFFSSFDYLQQVSTAFARRHPDIPTWTQSRAMAARERNAFLARFTDEGRGIGFAVLGGSFGEAVDLPGKRLIGAFVATLGLPPLNPVNESIRRRMEAAFGAGYAYTYLYPGIQKVVQAVGRVIRSHEDAGVVHLIDDRFERAEVRRLFPSWWKIAPASGNAQRAAHEPARPQGQPMQVRFLPVRLAS
jgi:DNA excision repair protein ERCC-2